MYSFLLPGIIFMAVAVVVSDRADWAFKAGSFPPSPSYPPRQMQTSMQTIFGSVKYSQKKETSLTADFI